MSGKAGTPTLKDVGKVCIQAFLDRFSRCVWAPIHTCKISGTAVPVVNNHTRCLSVSRVESSYDALQDTALGGEFIPVHGPERVSEAVSRTEPKPSGFLGRAIVWLFQVVRGSSVDSICVLRDVLVN